MEIRKTMDVRKNQVSFGAAVYVKFKKGRPASIDSVFNCVTGEANLIKKEGADIFSISSSTQSEHIVANTPEKEYLDEFWNSYIEAKTYYKSPSLIEKDAAELMIDLENERPKPDKRHISYFQDVIKYGYDSVQTNTISDTWAAKSLIETQRAVFDSAYEKMLKAKKEYIKAFEKVKNLVSTTRMEV